MIRIIRTSESSTHYPDKQYKAPVKYYQNRPTKEEVKEDFGIVLEREIAKLKIDVIV